MAPNRPREVLQRILGELAGAGWTCGPSDRVVARPLPLAPLRRTSGDRVLAIGDAAGLVKPTTGGGIYYSLLSAGWAAESVADAFAHGDFSSTTLAGYEKSWRSHLGGEIAAGTWFRRLVGRLDPSDLDALTELAITDGIMPIVRASARFNWHRELIVQTMRHPGVLRIVLRRLAGNLGEGWDEWCRPEVSV